MTVTVVGEAEAEGEMEVTREVTRTVFERIDVAVVVVVLVLIDDIMDADNMVVVDISVSVFVAAVGSVGSDVGVGVNVGVGTVIMSGEVGSVDDVALDCKDVSIKACAETRAARYVALVLREVELVTLRSSWSLRTLALHMEACPPLGVRRPLLIALD